MVELNTQTMNPSALGRVCRLFAALALASGCATSAALPVSGLLYADAQGTHGATSNPIGPKQGESCATSILGLVAQGDASAATAAKNGSITKIATIDSKNTGILGIFAKNCTVVTGE
jgi:hypothetical protein